MGIAADGKHTQNTENKGFCPWVIVFLSNAFRGITVLKNLNILFIYYFIIIHYFTVLLILLSVKCRTKLRILYNFVIEFHSVFYIFFR